MAINSYDNRLIGNPYSALIMPSQNLTIKQGVPLSIKANRVHNSRISEIYLPCYNLIRAGVMSTLNMFQPPMKEFTKTCPWKLPVNFLKGTP